MKKFTIEDVRAYLFKNDINHDCELLSTEYINSHKPLLLKCNKCEEIFNRSFTNIKRNNKYFCARCAQGRNLEIEDVRNFLLENDLKKECTLISTVYKNVSSPLEFKCNVCGNNFFRNFTQVKEKHFKCYDCLKKDQGGYNKLSIEDIKSFIEQNDLEKDCDLLSTEYIDNQTPLLFKCNCCGKEFERTFATMKAKRAFKCFRCAHHLPEESETAAYEALKSYFRGKLYVWKKEFLSSHTECDILQTNEDIELDIHHLINFSTILKQASKNTNIPLSYSPQELEKYGYSLEELTKEFLKLHNDVSAVVLEKKLHQKFHKIYGYKNNTVEQYYEFKNKYLQGDIL